MQSNYQKTQAKRTSMDRMNSERKQQKHRTPFSLYGKILLGSIFIINLIAWHKILLSKYGLIDDHEIAKFEVDYEKFGFWQSFYQNSDFANWSNTPRFRPLNFLFRFSEATVTSFNPMYQYGIKLGIFFFNITICYYILLELRRLLTNRRIQIKTDGVILTSVMLSFSFIPEWVAVVGRLAPAEITAVPFALVMLLCALRLMNNSSRQITWLIFLTAQVGLIGSKEDSMFWVLLPIFVFFNLYLRKKIEKRKYVVFGIILSNIFTISILAILYRGTNGFRIDYYGAEHKPNDVIESLFLVFHWPPIWLSALVIAWVFFHKDRWIILRPETNFIMGFLFFAIVFQVAIYVSRGATERYILLPKILSCFILYIALLLLVEMLQISQNSKVRVKGMIVGVTLLLTLGSSLQSTLVGLHKFNQYAEQVYLSTNEFQKQVNQVLLLSNQDVLFFAQNPVDSFERTYSWIKFLNAGKDDLRFYLNTQFMDEKNYEVNPPLGKQLREFAISGNSAWDLEPEFRSKNHFSPVCVFLRFEPDAVPKVCRNLVISP